jgi:3-phenylpropionate/trans-cinnamate dioxygenase ferredoxin component
VSNDLVKLCSKSQLEEGKTKLFTVNNQPILLAKYNGEIFALDGVCTHDGGDLGDALLINGQLECPRHGARFDIKTGEATKMPAVVGVRRFEVHEQDSDIYIEKPIELEF